jgi:DNA-binding transcriptional MocR family regulator
MMADRTLEILHARLDRAAGPLYLAIADAIGQAIAQGELRPGDRLPPQRQLAVGMRVDLTTVTHAYTEARRRGLLDATVGRGTFVRGTEPVAPAPSAAGAMMDLSMNLPPQPAGQLLRRALLDGMSRLLRPADLAGLMAYRAGAGSRADREAAAAWLRPVVGDVEPERVLVCAGAQAAMTGLLVMLARPGDTVLAETLSYPTFRALAAQLGVRLVAVATDRDGLLPDALDLACREHHPKALYCTPTIHNPTTATLPPERRLAVAEVARRHDLPIIEDDAYGLLPTQALPAVTSLAPRAGYYIATLSKCLSPGLRVGFVVAPDASGAARLATAVRATSLGASPLTTSLATQWLRDGTAAAVRDAVRAEAVARQLVAREILPPSAMAAHPEGLQVWLQLPDHWNRGEFSTHMRRQGLALVPSDAFLVGPTAPNAVRIALGAADNRDALRTALHSVVAAMQDDTPDQLADVV